MAGETENRNKNGALTKKKKRKKSGTVKVWKRIVLLVVVLALLAVAAYFANGYITKSRYKLLYPDEIKVASLEYTIDPYLVAAVIHCESGNRASVVSAKGAVGLMQIMPETGAWIAEKLEMSDYSESMLSDPAINIVMGCWYLNFLLEKYDGDTTLALSAYNAGPGNVDKWLENPEYSENGVLIDIPFDETKTYITRVSDAKRVYMDLYEKELG